MTERVVARVDTAALMRLGAGPTGPIFRHMATVGAKVETRAKRNASNQIVGVRTGNLRSSIGTHIENVGTRVVATVTAAAAYAYAVHEGTRPHEITAAPGRVLAWRSPTGPRFSRRVHHPGTKPRPFLREALNAVAD